MVCSLSDYGRTKSPGHELEGLIFIARDENGMFKGTFGAMIIRSGLWLLDICRKLCPGQGICARCVAFLVESEAGRGIGLETYTVGSIAHKVDMSALHSLVYMEDEHIACTAKTCAK